MWAAMHSPPPCGLLAKGMKACRLTSYCGFLAKGMKACRLTSYCGFLAKGMKACRLTSYCFLHKLSYISLCTSIVFA